MARIDHDIIFYGFDTIKKWNISEDVVNTIKKIKWKSEEGCYTKILVSTEIDNIDIIKNYCGEFNSSDFYNRVSIGIQFLTRHIRFHDLDEDFIKNNSIEQYHIDLINRLYFDEEFDDFVIISTPDKRPFGNSSIEYDILDVLYPGQKDSDKRRKEEIEKCWIVFDEMFNILIKLFKEFPMEFRNFVSFNNVEFDKISLEQKSYYSHGWAPCISEFREIKINNILNEK
jgi:hypothetical protein